MAGAIFLLQSCSGILSGIYDEPSEEVRPTQAGQLYIDASDWTQWHYIDLAAVADSVSMREGFNPSSLWHTEAIPFEKSDGTGGIYTYWYDVFGEGVTKREFRDYYPTKPQPEPARWSVAVHRNNVRTNGGAVWLSPYSSIDELPEGNGWLNNVNFTPDEWNETDVWTVQDRMLLGLVGNQGIEINPELGKWLTMEIPPMPPVYQHNSGVFVLKLADGSFAALQLADYVSPSGKKCCLTINYRYPL